MPQTPTTTQRRTAWRSALLALRRLLALSDAQVEGLAAILALTDDHQRQMFRLAAELADVERRHH